METELKEAKEEKKDSEGISYKLWPTWGLLDVERPEGEVRDALNEVKDVFNNLVMKHDEHAKMIDDNALF